MKNDLIDNSLDLSFNRNKISNEKLLMGSTSDKFPVVLNDGRTIIYITDKNKEAEIRLKYELLKDQKYPSRNPRHQK
jgi:hypothetical protein